MARLGVFRWVRVASTIASALPIFGAAGCGDVEIVQAGIAPTVSAIEPTKGPSLGGTPVVITGQNFQSGATVRIGGALAENVKWVDAKTISAVTPAGAGVASVTVENPTHLVGTKDDAFTYEGAGTGCAVLSTIPEIGADEVPVVGELRLVYSAPIDVASLEGAVKLQLLDGGEVPIDVTLGAETDTDVIVRPKQSLRFWGSYAISIGDGVLATDGSACAPAALAFATVKPKTTPRALRPALVSGVAITGGFAIVASEGYKGLQTYDVATPASASLKSDFVGKFGPRGVVIHGSRAYAPSGATGVQIFDVTDPTKPVILGHAGTPGRANDVAIVDAGGKTYAVIADSSEGIRVVEVTDPSLPVDLGTLALGDPEKPVIGAIDVQGSTIAATDGSRVRLLQLPDPATPATSKVLGTFDAGATLGDVVLANDRLYATKQSFGVVVYDITNPADAVQIDAEDDPDGVCPDGCLDIASTVVKDGSDLFVAFGRGGAQRFTIDGAGLLTPSTIYKGVSNARTVAVAGSSVYVGADEGLAIYDRNGDGASPLWSDQTGHGITRTASVSGDHLYVGDWLRGVQTFSIQDPEAPVLLDRDDTPGGLTDVGGYGTAASDGVLAVGDGRAGVTLFDLSDPANPVIGGTVDTIDALTTVVKVGSVTYGCDGNQGIVAIDSSDPKSPKLLGEAAFDPPGNAAPDLAPAGDVLYVATRFGLGVLDVKDPTAMTWKGMVELPQKAAVSSVRVVGSHVVATTSLFDFEGANSNAVTRLVVFDATDPLAPVLVWSSDDLGGAQHLAIAGDIAFVASGGASLKIFDLSNIEEPVLEGILETPANVSFTTVGKDVVYTIEGAGGLQAIHTGPLPAAK